MKIDFTGTIWLIIILIIVIVIVSISFWASSDFFDFYGDVIYLIWFNVHIRQLLFRLHNILPVVCKMLLKRQMIVRSESPRFRVHFKLALDIVWLIFHFYRHLNFNF